MSSPLDTIAVGTRTRRSSSSVSPISGCPATASRAVTPPVVRKGARHLALLGEPDRFAAALEPLLGRLDNPRL